MNKKRIRIIIASISFVILMTVAIILLINFGKDDTTDENGGKAEEAPTPEVPKEEPDNAPDEPEYTLPKEEGHNQLTFFYAGGADTDECRIYAKWDGRELREYRMYPCEYGGKVVINVPEDIDSVSFYIRINCSNTDPEGTDDGIGYERTAEIIGEETFIYLKENDSLQYSSTDGGKTLTVINKFTFACIIDVNKIAYCIFPKASISSSSAISVSDGENELSVVDIRDSDDPSFSGIIEVAEELDISKSYTLSIGEYGKQIIIPTSLFDREYFVENYTYNGDDLGANANGDFTIFKLWAPTASSVVLNLFYAGDHEPYKSIDMEKAPGGVWTFCAECTHGTYYTYTVTTAFGTEEVRDPYAKAASADGVRGMVVDLSLTNPVKWGEKLNTGIESYRDAVIWRVNIGDFPYGISSSEYKGKYLSFTERDLKNEHGISVGIDHLAELGVTHVQISSLFESGAQFLDVPAGRYSTDPESGDASIRELKELIEALHSIGIGVIIEVDFDVPDLLASNLSRTVPYYYSRYDADGTPIKTLGNDACLATERYMCEKFILDSVRYWTEEYNIDGFAFNSMGICDVETMQNIEKTVHAINPYAIIYGDGEDMGITVDGITLATQKNVNGIKGSDGAIGSVSVLNSVMRDALIGNVSSENAAGYVSGTCNDALDGVMFGIRGGYGSSVDWSVNDSMIVNHIRPQSGLYLFEHLKACCPYKTEDEIRAMYRLAVTLVAISRGTILIEGGEEMQISGKLGYSDFNTDSPEYKMMTYYKDMISLRKSFDIFMCDSCEISNTVRIGGGTVITFEKNNGEKALVIVNPSGSETTYTLSGEWYMISDGESVFADAPITTDVTVTVPAHSAVILMSITKM